MLVQFNTLPGTSRIWIYQSSKELTESDQNLIRNEIEPFIQSWTAHQADLKAGFEILYNRFLIIAVDENHNDASGCSIDKKVNFVKQLGDKINSDFLNRLQIAYLDKEILHVADMHTLINQISKGILGSDTLIFNNLISTIEEFRTAWKIPAGQSWLKQLFIIQEKNKI